MARLFSRLATAGGIIAVITAVGLGNAVRSAAAHTIAAPAAASKTTLLIARTLDDMRTMDPDRMYEFSSAAAGSNIFDPLITLNGSNLTKPLPNLATSWTIKKNGTLYTFQLRHDVRFST